MDSKVKWLMGLSEANKIIITGRRIIMLNFCMVRIYQGLTACNAALIGKCRLYLESAVVA